jgi:hypothetical protein
VIEMASQLFNIVIYAFKFRRLCFRSATFNWSRPVFPSCAWETKGDKKAKYLLIHFGFMSFSKQDVFCFVLIFIICLAILIKKRTKQKTRIK